MSRPPLPPPLARRLLALLATDSLGDDMLAELEAEFRIRAAEDGLGAARRWYRRQVWLSVPALLGARRRARPETGRGARPVVEFFRDTRLALRTLRGAPMFSLVAIATLALGIGTSTAVFSVVNGVVLRPLPYRSPDRLVQVWGPQAISKATLVRIRNEVPALGRTAGFYRERAVLTGIDDALEVTGTAVSANYFDVLGVAPALGRFFRPDENEPARADAIVLSHGLWSRAFGRDPGVIGRQVTLAGRSRTVVGVTSPGHRAMLPGTEFWIPYTADPTDFSDYEGLARLELIARLDDGVPAARAAADLGVLARALQRERPESYSDEWVGRATVVPLATSLTAGVASPLWTMLGAVAFVLLIACANVANLLLARGTGRAAEIAVRMGLGASRNRVIRQLLAESTVLGALGGLAGLGLAVAAVVLAGAALPASVLRGEPIVVDRTVLAFGLAVSLASSLLFGVAPAVQATGRGVAAQLREGRGRAATANRRRHGVTMGLVSLQIAASVTLVTGAGLMVRSFAGIRAADLGFVPEQAITMRIRLPTSDRYRTDAERAAFFGELDRQIRAIPGVVTAGLGSHVPMSPGAAGSVWSRPDRPADPGEARAYTNFTIVTAGYPAALGLQLLGGRPLSDADAAGMPMVGLINETMARSAFGADDPVGHPLELFGGGAKFTVVGVVRDAHQDRPDRPPAPEVFLPYAQASFFSGLHLVARITGEPAAPFEAIRRTVRNLDPDVAIAGQRAMDDVVTEATSDSRFFTWLVTAFGALALILGAIGIYGVLSCVVTERLPEFGIRMALGAPASRVTREAMARLALPVGLGLGLGVAGALATTGVLRRLLFGISPTDPVAFAAAPVVLIVVALAAGYLAARRAGRVGLPAVLGR